ncbi:MAG: DUF2071 domain-containing protein [Salinibacter sp.]|uniref:DUF2071 domain-containing protein n=1 Tax=Salinibacter sp. TaxID=2065818 RepID=UPI0035D49FD0
MSSPASFSQPHVLRATARHRVVVAYAVAPDRVASHLPGGLVPDERDGNAYVSLVGVELTNVRVLGLTGPGFRRVPAVELRAHVRRAHSSSGTRGTWTVRAHVPRYLVAWAAQWLYGEPVEVASMQPVWREQVEEVEATYRFDWKGREQRVRARGTKPPVMPVPDTLADTLGASSVRFGTTRDGALLRTRVERPSHPIYRVQEHHVTMQWPAVYGDIGRALQDKDPVCVLLSPGAPVALRWRERV